MRPPYPVEIVPLIPQFLTRRRSKMTAHLAAMEEMGLDRPAFFWVLNLSYRGERGGTTRPGDLESAYGTIKETWMPQAAAARAAGLAEERDGRWLVTGKGRALAQRMHDAARAHFATLTPLPTDELAEVAHILERAFAAAARATEPRERLRTPFAFGYRGDDPADGSFAQLDAALYGLWQVRDDCHIAAWRASGLSGPDVEVLTRIWRNEAKDEQALCELLPHQRPSDVRSSIDRFRERGLVEQGALRMTPEGAKLRQRIENETDRLFFTSWPDDVGARGSWIAEKLTQVNAALV